MALDGFVVGVRLGGVGVVLAAEEAEVGDGSSGGTGLDCARCGNLIAEEVGAVDVVEIEGRAGVGGFGGDFDVAELEVLDVADVHAGGGQIAEHGGLGIFVGVLCGWIASHVGAGAAYLVQVNVADLQVFDGMVRLHRR